jgi:DNA-binding MarR family transcriptional regulator
MQKPPQWLTRTENDAWMAVVALMFKLPAALDTQLRRDSGLTHFEYAVLVSLSGRPTRTMHMSELAEASHCSLSRLSHVVKRMEDKGWIDRSPLPTDGRVTVARLTGEGFVKLASAAPGHVAEARRLVLDALSPQQLRQLRDIGTSIVDTIGSDG